MYCAQTPIILEETSITKLSVIDINNWNVCGSDLTFVGFTQKIIIIILYYEFGHVT